MVQKGQKSMNNYVKSDTGTKVLCIESPVYYLPIGSNGHKITKQKILHPHTVKIIILCYKW